MLSDVQFETLAARYIDMIYAVAFSALKNRADAEDVTQDVLNSCTKRTRSSSHTPMLRTG